MDIWISYLLVVLLVIQSNCDIIKSAPSCSEDNCKPPNCRCSSTEIPGGLTPEQTPQFVLLTFDDAVTVSNMVYYREALFNKMNPNDCPVAATFYVSHEYTDYTLVNELYNNGQEIALHSVTHQTNTEYWKNMNVSEYAKEFSSQRILMSHFANIPHESFKGLRVPYLQFSGDNYFQMLNEEGFTYDCTWPTQKYASPGLWPYTLDTLSVQDCVIGPCPTEAWDGSWVIPMIAWRDKMNIPCSMVDTCVNLPDTVDGLVEFMIENFNQTYNTNKAPIGFYVHSAWFLANELGFAAYTQFIDYLQSLSDVFLVSSASVIDWIKNPIPVNQMRSSDWSKCHSREYQHCDERMCPLMFKEETRYLKVCTECPKQYPWKDNPLGE